tara:strand:- start:1208 stop:1771 length:564 start_codon:yes stop_codon:yes gene_type:complete
MTKKLGNKLILHVLFIVSIMQCNTVMATIYCAHGSGYLKVGMSKNQVQQACGEPISQSKKKKYGTRNIAIKQLFYTLKKNTRSAYGPSSNTQTINIVVTIMNNKVTEINLGGNKTQAASVCANGTIQVGLPMSSITQACGTPSYINNSFKKISQGNLIEQEIWQIKTSQYGKNRTLTFSDDTLISIQ